MCKNELHINFNCSKAYDCLLNCSYICPDGQIIRTVSATEPIGLECITVDNSTQCPRGKVIHCRETYCQCRNQLLITDNCKKMVNCYNGLETTCPVGFNLDQWPLTCPEKKESVCPGGDILYGMCFVGNFLLTFCNGACSSRQLMNVRQCLESKWTLFAFQAV